MCTLRHKTHYGRAEPREKGGGGEMIKEKFDARYESRCYLCATKGPLMTKQLAHGIQFVCEDEPACIERVKDKLWPERPTLVPGGFK